MVRYMLEFTQTDKNIEEQNMEFLGE